MYNFHYNIIKKHFGAELLFTDTDSFTYERKSEDVSEEKNLFHFSNFSKGSKFYDSRNEMIAGEKKNVYEGIPTNKFVGLKPKMHSMLSDNGKESSTAEEVNIATEFKEYEKALLNNKIKRHKMKRIQSKKHKIGTYEIRNQQKSISCFDD